MVLEPEAFHDSNTRKDLECLDSQLRECLSDPLRQALYRPLEDGGHNYQGNTDWHDEKGETPVHYEEEADRARDRDRILAEVVDILLHHLLHLTCVAENARN